MNEPNTTQPQAPEPSPEPPSINLGELSYNAYCNHRGWKSVRGEPLPPYGAQDGMLKEAWEAAAVAVWTQVMFGAPPKEFDGTHRGEIVCDKRLRRAIDTNIQRVKVLPPSRERSLAITKLQEAVMWLGMDLKRLNEPNPYPNSKDPSNTTIDPTADGLKL